MVKKSGKNSAIFTKLEEMLKKGTVMLPEKFLAKKFKFKFKSKEQVERKWKVLSALVLANRFNCWLTTKALAAISNVPERWIENHFKDLRKSRKEIKFPSFQRVDIKEKLRLLGLEKARIAEDNSRYCYSVVHSRITIPITDYVAWIWCYKVCGLKESFQRVPKEEKYKFIRNLFSIFGEVAKRFLFVFYLNSSMSKTSLLYSFKKVEMFNSEELINALCSLNLKNLKEKVIEQPITNKLLEISLDIKPTVIKLPISKSAIEKCIDKIEKESQFINF